MELLHVLRQFPTQFVDARNQRLKVVVVLNAGRLCDLFDPLSLQSDQVHP
jgi:hypothetical protein